MKKFIYVIIALVILGGVGFQLYKKLWKKDGLSNKRNQAAVAVETAPVERTVLREVGEFSGSLTPIAQFVVAPKIGGRLEKLTVGVGDTVRHGELIAVLDDDEATQQVEQARAELEVAQAGLEDSNNTLLLAGRDYERIKALEEKRIASTSELDKAEADLRAAEAKSKVSQAQVRQKEAALRAAEVRLSYTRIKATWNGGNGLRVIGERFANEGDILVASEKIVSVLDIDTLTAVIKVIERDYTRVREGLRAIVTCDLFPGREFEATVARVAPILKEEARQADVEVAVPNPARVLKPGMFVRVSIEYSRKESVQSVPIEALVRRNGEQGVFLVDGDGQGDMRRARFVPVRTGIRNEGKVEIPDPPLAGFVITLGNHLVEDGAPVRVGGAPGAPEGSPQIEDSPEGRPRDGGAR
jgi:RND family efflux transporter MFP subunit